MMFPVEIWGTVAAWFGAIVTSFSFAGAVIFFIANKVREDHAQARHIRLDRNTSDKDKCWLVVYNDSDESIFDVSFHLKRKKFKDWVLGPGVGPVSKEKVNKAYNVWLDLSMSGRSQDDFENGRVRAGEYKDLNFNRPYSGANEYSVTFRDALAVKWELTLGSDRPVRVREWPRSKWLWSKIRYPKESAQEWRYRRRMGAHIKEIEKMGRAPESPIEKS